MSKKMAWLVLAVTLGYQSTAIADDHDAYAILPERPKVGSSLSLATGTVVYVSVQTEKTHAVIASITLQETGGEGHQYFLANKVVVNGKEFVCFPSVLPNGGMPREPGCSAALFHFEVTKTKVAVLYWPLLGTFVPAGSRATDEIEIVY